MPVYCYTCQKCEKEWDSYVPLTTSPNPAYSCGSPSERIWKVSHAKGADTYPYTTSHITGSPIEIRSPAHLKEIEKKHGVRLRDDAGWLEKRIGLNEKGLKTYYEGNGRGLPGSWV
jgi:hypothetical protein